MYLLYNELCHPDGAQARRSFSYSFKKFIFTTRQRAGIINLYREKYPAPRGGPEKIWEKAVRIRRRKKGTIVRMGEMKRRKIRIAAVLLAGALLAVGFAGCQRTAEPEEESSTVSVVEDLTVFPEGTKMDNVDISGMKLSEAREACRAEIMKQYENLKVTLVIDKTKIEVSGKDVTIVDTLDITLTRLLKDRKPGSYKISYSLKLQKLEDELQARLDEFNVEGQDASVESYDYDKGEFVFKESVDGQKLDLKKTITVVREQFKKGVSGIVEAVMEKTPAKVTTEQLKKDFVKISEYETVSTNTENGNHNMALALFHVDGTVVQPGETFSYEDTVGDSTSAATGFLPAGGLSGGALVQMYGGGICQASSTIYGAAIRAGMTITMRYCHSSPSTYVPIGLDATVSYGDLDFRFRNDLDTPVYIMC